MPLTPRDLVDLVASTLQLPVSMVRNFDRKLMESGLRSKHGRGRSSAIMTPADAAWILLALTSCDELSRVAKSVVEVSALPYWADADLDSVRQKNDAHKFAEIVGKQNSLPTFGAAVCALVEFLAANPRGERQFGFAVESAGGRPLQAIISVWWGDEYLSVRFRHAGLGPTYWDHSSALQVERRISWEALFVIAAKIGSAAGKGR
jgi:hypothetical protein